MLEMHSQSGSVYGEETVQVSRVLLSYALKREILSVGI